MAGDDRLTVTVEEAARMLGIGRGTAYDAVRRGDVPSIRVGHRILVPRAPLLELVGAGALASPEMREPAAFAGSTDSRGDERGKSSP
jgi:excisionase family DNA binding protein